MFILLSDLLLFSCLAVLITGMVIVVASLLFESRARMDASSVYRAQKPRHGRPMAGFLLLTLARGSAGKRAAPPRPLSGVAIAAMGRGASMAVMFLHIQRRTRAKSCSPWFVRLDPPTSRDRRAGFPASLRGPRADLR